MLVWLALARCWAWQRSLAQRGAGAVDVLPGGSSGLVTWVAVHSALTDALFRGQRRPELESRERRVFLMVAGAVAVASVGIAVAGRFVGAGRRQVEASRRLLRIPGVTRRQAPAATSIGLRGIAPWQTPNEDFYRIDTAIALPTIAPEDWSLRIHGLVDRELTLTYSDLVARQMTESWITLNCVSNEVGGGLVGNARWSGVRIADLLADLGVSDEADCVLQTSHDGWFCATPLAALTDDRDAMLAVAMNGRPLPIEHGFPVRTVVPGLYGYVSATKWVVDYEVTTFDRGGRLLDDQGLVGRWARSRSPRASTCPAPVTTSPPAQVAFGGVAWHQHTGIEAVEVQVDGGEWQPAPSSARCRRSTPGSSGPSPSTWPRATTRCGCGRSARTARPRPASCRAPDPDGSTGLHTIQISAS